MHLDHRAGGEAVLADAIEKTFVEARGLRIRAEEGVLAHLIPVPVGAVDSCAVPSAPARAAHFHAGHDLACDCAGRHPRRRLPRRRTPAAAMVADAVFGVIDVIRMAGPVAVGDLAIILAALICVLDHQRDRCSGRALQAIGFSEHAGENAHRIRLLPLRGEAAGAGLAAVKISLDIRLRSALGAAGSINDAAKGNAVAFPEGGDAEKMAECVVRHVFRFCSGAGEGQPNARIQALVGSLQPSRSVVRKRRIEGSSVRPIAVCKACWPARNGPKHASTWRA